MQKITLLGMLMTLSMAPVFSTEADTQEQSLPYQKLAQTAPQCPNAPEKTTKYRGLTEEERTPIPFSLLNDDADLGQND